jgi:hypothetical protein
LTPLDHIVAIVGSKAALAAIINRHPSQVTRFVKYGYLPAEHNKAVEAWVADGGDAAVLEHLQPVCACCGHALDRV